MPGRAPRQKGDRFERALVKRFRELGRAAERCWGSGSTRGTNKSGYDLSVPIMEKDCRVEVKHYANGFAMLYNWLENADVLIVRRDHAAPLVVLPFEMAIKLFDAAEGKKK